MLLRVRASRRTEPRQRRAGAGGRTLDRGAVAGISSSSRLFEQLDLPALRPLPAYPYEIVTFEVSAPCTPGSKRLADAGFCAPIHNELHHLAQLTAFVVTESFENR